MSGLTKGLQNATLNVTNPGYNKRNNVVIQSTTNDPLVEHSLDVLDRLPQDMMIGRGKNKYKINIDKLKKCCHNKLRMK